MKSLIKFLVVTIIASSAINSVEAQVKQKKVQQFTVISTIDAPIDDVWKVVGEDYGAIANSHPKIMSSEYVNGSMKAGEGAQRVCHFNAKGTKYLQEKQVNYDPANYYFRNQVFSAGKFPVDPEYTFGDYQLESTSDGKTKFIFTMNYRTKPAFMGAMAKGQFKRLIRDYAIAIEHNVKTGEKVNKGNFKEIKKMYSDD